MKRHQVEIFGVSFIDLMAGALGAVLILFIVIPKVTVEQYDQMKEMRQIETLLTDTMQRVREKKDPDSIAQLLNELESMLRSITEKVRQLAAQNNALKKENSRLRNDNAEFEAKLKRERLTYTERIATLRKTIEAQKKMIGQAGSHDVGFHFRGRRIVFVMDVSGSMREYDKLGQVKAGLKMLMSMMNSSYRIAVLIFPGKGNSSDSMALWQGYRIMDEVSRRQASIALLSVNVEGGTPTRAAMREAFRRWPDATDIVLLSDGEPMPSRHSKVGDAMDDIPDLLREITSRNNGRVAIHTIGVGREFSRHSDAPAVMFLRELAARNGGFYTGF